MNKKSSRKILTVILSIIILVVAIIPSFAAGTTVGTEADLRTAIDDAASGDIITLGADIELTALLEIVGKTITIKGGGKTLTAADSFVKSAETLKNNLVTVANGADVTFENITLKTKAMNRHTLNVYSAKVGLKDVTLDHSIAETGAPLIIGTGIVAVSGKFDVIAGPNSWYGINVDNHIGANDGDAALNIAANAAVSFETPGAQRFICIEQQAGKKAASVTLPESFVKNAVKDEAGNVKTYYGTSAAINVVDEATLREAIADAVAGSVITLKNDIALSSYLNIAHMSATPFTIDGAGFAITAAADFAGTEGNNTTFNLVQLENSDVAFKNISIITSAKNRHALNVYQSNTTLTDVKLDHTNSFAGAPLIAVSSTVTIGGVFEPVLGESSWYAVNLDNKYNLSTSITFETGASVVFTDSKRAFIFSETPDDGTTAIVGMDAIVTALGLVKDTDATGNEIYRLAKNIISVAIDKTDINALAGKEDSFVATVQLDSASSDVTLADFNITNSADAFATVDGGTAVLVGDVLTITFNVKTVAVGTATITIALKENTALKADITVNVLNKPDYTELDIQVADYTAKLATKDNYEPATWAAVEAEVVKANALDRNTLTTLADAEVTAVTNSLKTALSNLVLKKAVLTNLNAQITAFEALTEEQYTSATWATAKAAYDVAIAFDANTTIDKQAEVNAAQTALVNAISALVLRPADFTNLNAQITAFEALTEDQYTPATWATAKAAYDTAKTFDANTTIDKQADVDAAQTALVKTIGDLVLKDANAENLNTALAAAEKALATTGVYSKKALAELQVLVDEAKALLASNPTILDQEKVDEKIAELDAFIEKLVELDYTVAEEEAKKVAEVKAEDYEQDENWTAFSAAVKELEALLENKEAEEQEDIDAAVKKVADAQALLVKAEVVTTTATTTTPVETTTSKSDEKPAPSTGDKGLSVALTALGLGGLALVLFRKREEKEEA